MIHIACPFSILVFVPDEHLDCRLPIISGYSAVDTIAIDSCGHSPNELKEGSNHLAFAYLCTDLISDKCTVVLIYVILISNTWSFADDHSFNSVRSFLWF